MSIAIVILTLNEERHIERALVSISSFADLVVVVDSYSSDRTVEIAREHGAIIYQRPFKHQADQFQWAQAQVPTDFDWIMRLDADEVIEPDLAARIRAELPMLPAEVTAVTIDRKHIFMNNWVRHGGRYPLTLLRIFRRGRGRVEQRWMDEHIVVDGGRTVHFAGGFSDYNLNDLTFFTEKHNKYATREAIDAIGLKYGLFDMDQLSADNTSAQASRKRHFKEQIYNRLPFWVGPLGYFLYRFIFQAGFLDGRSGMIYHVLQGFWYRFLVGAKIFEYEEAMRDCKTNAERLTRLEELTGSRLRPTA